MGGRELVHVSKSNPELEFKSPAEDVTSQPREKFGAKLRTKHQTHYQSKKCLDLTMQAYFSAITLAQKITKMTSKSTGNN